MISPNGLGSVTVQTAGCVVATKKKINFEQSLEDLEKLIETMEDGDQSLEDSLKLFEKGVKLTRDCQQALQDAEQKVEMILKVQNGDQQNDEKVVTTPFTQDDES